MTNSAFVLNVFAVVILLIGIISLFHPAVVLRLRENSKWLRLDYGDPTKFLYASKYRHVTVRVIGILQILVAALILIK